MTETEALARVSWGAEVCNPAHAAEGTPDVLCWIETPWHKFGRGSVGLRRPLGEDFSVWELKLAVTTGTGVKETWPLNALIHVKRFTSAARDARGLCCCGWAARPPCPDLEGFEVKSASGLLIAAARAGDVQVLDRLRQIHAWVCHALEDLSNETEEHAMTPHAWTSGITVMWPIGSKAEALRHLAAQHYQISLTTVRQLLTGSKFAGSECPVCLEPWATMAPDAPAAALRCGHACCEACLDRCGVRAGVRLDCPVCRLPAAVARTSVT